MSGEQPAASAAVAPAPHYTAAMPHELPADLVAAARQKGRRRQDTKAADQAARIEWYKALQDLLLDPATGRPWRGRYGWRGKVAEALNVDYELLRYVERVDIGAMQADLEQSIAARRGGGG